MFNENLKVIRKAKGYTQEELAIKLNVVRQTVSKWEKGLSVSDADLLIKIADVLEVDVADLLGAPITTEENKNEIACQLAKISEQMAIRNRLSKRIWKIIGIVLLCILIGFIMLSIAGIVIFSARMEPESSSVSNTISGYIGGHLYF